MTMSDVNSVCERIHSLVQMSGLHFNINQTPWSSYITIRRKFVSPGSYDVKTMCTESVVMEQLKEKIKQLEHKLAGAEFQLEELEEKFANEQEKHEKTINLLNSKIDTLEKDKKLKEEIIQNTNTHFNTKVSDLDSKVEEFEAPKKEGFKSEKKALKKQKQKLLKEAVKNSMEPENKDVNQNNIVNDTDLSGNKESPSLPEPNHSPYKQCSPTRRVPATPLRRCTPATPPSPHTPTSLPPSSSRSSSQTLSCYFEAAAPELVQNLAGTEETFITTDYIKSISKLSLAPRQRKNNISSKGPV